MSRALTLRVPPRLPAPVQQQAPPPFPQQNDQDLIQLLLIMMQLQQGREGRAEQLAFKREENRLDRILARDQLSAEQARAQSLNKLTEAQTGLLQSQQETFQNQQSRKAIAAIDTQLEARLQDSGGVLNRAFTRLRQDTIDRGVELAQDAFGSRGSQVLSDAREIALSAAPLQSTVDRMQKVTINPARVAGAAQKALNSGELVARTFFSELRSVLGQLSQEQQDTALGIELVQAGMRQFPFDSTAALKEELFSRLQSHMNEQRREFVNVLSAEGVSRREASRKVREFSFRTPSLEQLGFGRVNLRRAEDPIPAEPPSDQAAVDPTPRVLTLGEAVSGAGRGIAAGASALGKTVAGIPDIPLAQTGDPFTLLSIGREPGVEGYLLQQLQSGALTPQQLSDTERQRVAALLSLIGSGGF